MPYSKPLTGFGTGRVRTVVLKSSPTVGNVQVVCPYTGAVLKDDTPANVVTYLTTEMGYTNITTGAVLEYAERGQELRGVQVGTNTMAFDNTSPVSAGGILGARAQ